MMRHNGVELLVNPELVKQSRLLSIDLKKFLFLKHLKASAELTNGLVLGKRPALTD